MRIVLYCVAVGASRRAVSDVLVRPLVIFSLLVGTGRYGRTYSRVTIESCIEREGQDPLVRRDLTKTDPLYPNLAVQKMLDIYESGPASPSASYSAPPTPGGVFEEASGSGGTGAAAAGAGPDDFGFAPEGHSPETIRLVNEVCRSFPDMEQRAGQVCQPPKLLFLFFLLLLRWQAMQCCGASM